MDRTLGATVLTLVILVAVCACAYAYACLKKDREGYCGDDGATQQIPSQLKYDHAANDGCGPRPEGWYEPLPWRRWDNLNDWPRIKVWDSYWWN